MGGPLQDNTPYSVAFRRAVYQGVPSGVVMGITTYQLSHSVSGAVLAGVLAFGLWALGRGAVEGYVDTRAAK